MPKKRKQVLPKELPDKTWFVPDPNPDETSSEKNTELAALLAGAWNDLNIVRIDRIEVGSEKGWKVTYRD